MGAKRRAEELERLHVKLRGYESALERAAAERDDAMLRLTHGLALAAMIVDLVLGPEKES